VTGANDFMKNKTHTKLEGQRLLPAAPLLDHTDWSQFLTLYGGKKNRESLFSIQPPNAKKKIREWLKSRSARWRELNVHHPVGESFSLDHIGALNPTKLLQFLKKVANAIPRVGWIRYIAGGIAHIIVMLVWSNVQSSGTDAERDVERKNDNQ
jgi:hypothetical protein